MFETETFGGARCCLPHAFSRFSRTAGGSRRHHQESSQQRTAPAVQAFDAPRPARAARRRRSKEIPDAVDRCEDAEARAAPRRQRFGGKRSFHRLQDRDGDDAIACRRPPGSMSREGERCPTSANNPNDMTSGRPLSARSRLAGYDDCPAACAEIDTVIRDGEPIRRAASAQVATSRRPRRLPAPKRPPAGSQNSGQAASANHGSRSGFVRGRGRKIHRSASRPTPERIASRRPADRDQADRGGGTMTAPTVSSALEADRPVDQARVRVVDEQRISYWASKTAPHGARPIVTRRRSASARSQA